MKNMLLIIDLQNNFINENTKDIGLKYMEIMHEKARKQVICLNTGEIFDSLTSAAKFSGLK